MKLDDVGVMIGCRELDLAPDRKVSVVIGVPQEESGDYFCPYKILGLGEDTVKYAFGIDPLQALQLTLKKIGTDLYTSEEAKNGTLTWEGALVEGDLGFPVPDVLADLFPK